MGENTFLNERDFLFSFFGPSRKGFPLGDGMEMKDIAAFVILMLRVVRL